MSRHKSYKAKRKESKFGQATFIEDWEMWCTVPHRYLEYTLPPPNDDAASIRNIVDIHTLIPIWADVEGGCSCEYIGGYQQLFDPTVLERMIYNSSAVVNAVHLCALHDRQYAYIRQIVNEVTRLFVSSFRQQWQAELDKQRDYVVSVSPFFDETWKLYDVAISDERWERSVSAIKQYSTLIAQWILQDYYIDPIWESLLAKFVDFAKQKQTSLASAMGFALKNAKQQASFTIADGKVYNGNERQSEQAEATNAPGGHDVELSARGSPKLYERIIAKFSGGQSIEELAERSDNRTANISTKWSKLRGDTASNTTTPP